MARYFFLISFFVNLNCIHCIPRPDDMFSLGLGEPDSDFDLFSPEEPNFSDSGFNDLTGNPDEVIFSPSDDFIATDPLTGHADAGTPLEDLFMTDNLMDFDQLQSSCETKGSVSNNVLKARDGSSCPSTEKNGNIELPDLFQDPEALWRKNPQQQPPPSEKQAASPLGSLLRMFERIGEETKCPPDFPVRCCTDLISGYTPSSQGPTLYYIKPVDCLASMFPFLFPAGDTPNVLKSGLAVDYKRCI